MPCSTCKSPEHNKRTCSAQMSATASNVAQRDPIDYILRVGDGVHFTRSRTHKRWGINSTHTKWVNKFFEVIQPGDRIWFIQNESKGKVLGVATYSHRRARETGPLIALTPTNEDLGWTESDGEWDTEIHYTNLYNLHDIPTPLLTDIKSPLVGRIYNPAKCAIDLPNEYKNIVRYLAPST